MGQNEFQLTMSKCTIINFLNQLAVEIVWNYFVKLKHVQWHAVIDIFLLYLIFSKNSA